MPSTHVINCDPSEVDRSLAQRHVASVPAQPMVAAASARHFLKHSGRESIDIFALAECLGVAPFHEAVAVQSDIAKRGSRELRFGDEGIRDLFWLGVAEVGLVRGSLLILGQLGFIFVRFCQ